MKHSFIVLNNNYNKRNGMNLGFSLNMKNKYKRGVLKEFKLM